MCIFQSEQVIKLRNVLLSLQKNELWPLNSPDLKQLDYHVWCVGHDAGMLSETHAKTVQHCRAKDCLAINMNDLPQEFTVHC